MERNKIYQGDCLKVLKTFPDESVSCVITSPPYFGLRSYLAKDHADKHKEMGSEITIQEHIQKLVDVFHEVKRVLRKDGSCWINYGDSYVSSGVAGKRFDLEENPGKQKLPDGSRAGRARVSGYKDKCLLMLPERLAIAMIDDGWILRQSIIWCKQVFHKKQGRTHGSAMPASVCDRFNKTHEMLYHFVKSKKYYFDLEAVKIPVQTHENRPDDYSPQGKQQGQRGEMTNYAPADHRGVNDQTKKNYGLKDFRDGNGTSGTKNLPSVWLISPEPSKEKHFACFPQKLIEIPIIATCPQDGVVLDPFFGAGTSGMVAKKLGRAYVGIELNAEYAEIAERRISGIVEYRSIFDLAKT